MGEETTQERLAKEIAASASKDKEIDKLKRIARKLQQRNTIMEQILYTKQEELTKHQIFLAATAKQDSPVHEPTKVEEACAPTPTPKQAAPAEPASPMPTLKQAASAEAESAPLTSPLPAAACTLAAAGLQGGQVAAGAHAGRLLAPVRAARLPIPAGSLLRAAVVANLAPGQRHLACGDSSERPVAQRRTAGGQIEAEGGVARTNCSHGKNSWILSTE